MFHVNKQAELVTLRFTSVVCTRFEFDVSVIVYVNMYEPTSLLAAVILVDASPVTVDVPLVVNVSSV
jgi:hypothetical protein